MAVILRYGHGSFAVTVHSHCSASFFVSEGHRKPETYSVKSCVCMILVHREACCWSWSEQ